MAFFFNIQAPKYYTVSAQISATDWMNSLHNGIAELLDGRDITCGEASDIATTFVRRHCVETWCDWTYRGSTRDAPFMLLQMDLTYQGLTCSRVHRPRQPMRFDHTTEKLLIAEHET